MIKVIDKMSVVYDKYYHSVDCFNRDLAKRGATGGEQLAAKIQKLSQATARKKTGICSGCMQRLED